MRTRDRKSVYLNIRITRDMDKKIRLLRRARRHKRIADAARALFAEGLQHAEERGEFAALPVRKKPRRVTPDPAPPPIDTPTPELESDSQNAAA